MKRLASKARVLAFALPVVLGGCGGHTDDASPPTTYSIGGTITGLGSNGLVLANGTDSTNPAMGALGFTFVQTVVGGSSYAVTVLTQPANATCSVSQGAGTVGTAAVTTVQVTCAANAYRVGGTISGLGSAGLVLANGADTVAPSMGASSFTFANAVAEGGSYAAGVQTQPSGTTCSVGNGSGTMGAADVTNVQVTCSPNAYGVGGTITGLTATGLVLANGADTTSPAANATSFALPAKVAFDGIYSVVVQQQPTGLSCTVGGAFPATMGAADVTNVSVT